MASARSGRCRRRCGTRSWRWGGGGFDRVVDRLDARLLAVRRMHGSGGRFRSFRRIDPLLLRPHGRGRARSRRSRSLVSSGGSGRHVGKLVVSSFGPAAAHASGIPALRFEPKVCPSQLKKLPIHGRATAIRTQGEPPLLSPTLAWQRGESPWRCNVASFVFCEAAAPLSSYCPLLTPLGRGRPLACPLPAPHASEGGARGDGRRERLSIKTMASMLGTPREDPSIVTK